MYDLYYSGYDYEPGFDYMWDDSMDYDLESYPLWVSKTKKKKKNKKRGGMGKLRPKKKHKKPLTKAQQVARAIQKAVARTTVPVVVPVTTVPVTTVPVTTTPSLTQQLQGLGLSPEAAAAAAATLVRGTSAPDLPYTIIPFTGSGLGPNIISYDGDCQLGNDLPAPGVAFPTQTWQGCLQGCIDNPVCKGFSFNEGSNTCFLKPGLCSDPQRPDTFGNGFNFTQIRG